MVAVDILTGYLGAGKTTLLRHALCHGLDARRVAVVVNELGAIGVDGTLLAGPIGVGAMVELTNGCICCTIDAPRFDRAIADLVERTGAELVVVETTGVADPLPLAERLRRIGFGIDAITTVVDAAALETQMARVPVVERQIAAADFVVIGKPDLVTGGALRRVERRVAAVSPRAARFVSERGRIDPALLFATGARRWWAPARPGPAAGATRVGAVTLRTGGAIVLDRFEAFLDKLPAAVVRAKGVLEVAGAGSRCVFNYTSGRRELSWMRLPRVTGAQAVFIGDDVGAHETALRSGFDACVEVPRVPAAVA